MTVDPRADRAARAWLDLTAVLAGLRPGGSFDEVRDGTAVLVTGVPLASLNGVADITGRADPDVIAAAAASPRLSGRLSWSIQVRGDTVDDRIAQVAAGHGLKKGHPRQVMVKDLTGDDLPPVAKVRAATGADSAAYLRTLAAGFEVEEQATAAFADPGLLDHPSMSAYLAEVDGEPVATAFGVRAGDQVGVFNVAVLPRFRRQGLGGAVTATVLSEAYADGARTAFLHTSVPGRPLYERMGFRLVENWTVFQ